MMGFLAVAAKATEPHVVELLTELEDGERAAVKCRPLISIDYLSMPNGVSAAIPILTGQRAPSDDMDAAERTRLYMWMREVVKKAVIAVRDVTEEGESVWRPVVMVDDIAEPEPVAEGDPRIKLPLRILENLNGGEIIDVANAIIMHTNNSKPMEGAKRKRSR